MTGDIHPARVFLGNVPATVTEEDIRVRFLKHGSVIGVNLFKGFAFVQFGEAEAARRAIQAENGIEINGKRLRVTIARKKKGPPDATKLAGPSSIKAPDEGPFRGMKRSLENDIDVAPEDSQPTPQPQPLRASVATPNECEIVCMSKKQRQYAELIEQKMVHLGFKVDILFPNADIAIGSILETMASRGVLLAIVVTALNEKHHSLSLSVLQGQHQEHRNMPLDEAMKFVANTFVQSLPPTQSRPAECSAAATGLPGDVRAVLGFLLDNRPLSVVEYDKVIRYLTSSRESLLRAEYGDNIPPSLLHPPIGPHMDPVLKAKQDDLHDRILYILNRQKEGKRASHSAESPSAAAAAATPQPSMVKKESAPSADPKFNASLQRAIDCLIKNGPNLLSPMHLRKERPDCW